MDLSKEEFIRKFKNAVKKKYNFFFVDIHNPHKELRFRRNFNEMFLYIHFLKYIYISSNPISNSIQILIYDYTC